MSNLNNRILYVSSLCSKAMESEMLNLGIPVGLQIQKYHRLMAKGIKENGFDVQALSFIRNMPVDNDQMETEEGIDYRYLSGTSSKFRVIARSFRYAISYLKKNENASVVCDVLNVSVVLGAILAGRLYRRDIIGIITDFPETMYDKDDLYSKIVWIIIKLCSSYVVLTEYMKEKLNTRKQTIVLEGHVDSNSSEIREVTGKSHTRICMYAGSVHKKFGIENLVKAFLSANIPDAVLYVFGGGDYEDELKKICDERIKYFGVVPNEEIVKLERQATLLVNPRPINERFTKYSFPSKNMEYMVSGTPLVTTKLPGMPKEYIEYIYLFDDDSIEGIRKTLIDLLAKPEMELLKKGNEAQNFVLNEKTENIQASKLLRLLH